MIRFLAIAILATTLLPASAEARKFRSGSRSHTDAGASPTGGSGSSTVVVPRVGRSSRPDEAKAGQPTRPPFPTASAAPVLLRVNSVTEPKIWCRSDVVVGGFCVVN
ncbi:hypothetical protein [Bosea sp. (in: a-proteobacteria)]|jgi:hypothetical protein|uniref:hypothetical protein n=1 Tax=Bosea sp. (in: a-proteobacteria) TaxID=1871050 RepID=UPI003F72F7D4